MKTRLRPWFVGKRLWTLASRSSGRWSRKSQLWMDFPLSVSSVQVPFPTYSPTYLKYFKGVRWNLFSHWRCFDGAEKETETEVVEQTYLPWRPTSRGRNGLNLSGVAFPRFPLGSVELGRSLLRRQPLILLQVVFFGEWYLYSLLSRLYVTKL